MLSSRPGPSPIFLSRRKISKHRAEAKPPSNHISIRLLVCFVTITTIVFASTLIHLHGRVDILISDQRRTFNSGGSDVPSTKNDKESSSSSSCGTIYFWGGHKSGSTTLAALLKHRAPNFTDHDPEGQFVQGTKEICWALSHNVGGGRIVGTKKRKWNDMKATCQSQRSRLMNDDHRAGDGVQFALDGCPFYHTSEQARRVLDEDPHARFIMIVRDPIERLVSHLNADMRRSANRNTTAGMKEQDKENGGFDEQVLRLASAAKDRIARGVDRCRSGSNTMNHRARFSRKKDKFVGRMQQNQRRNGKARIHGGMQAFARHAIDSSHSDPFALSLHGTNLCALLQEVPHPNRIIVIQTAALANQPQQVLNRIMNHIGGNPKMLPGDSATRKNDGTALGNKLDIGEGGEGTRQRILDILLPDIELFQELISKLVSLSRGSILARHRLGLRSVFHHYRHD